MSQLLLVHGAWGRASEFQGILTGLAEEGHRAQALDLPGHGEDATPISEVTMAAYVDRVIEAARAVEGRIVLVGHSLAGAIISQVAERIPEKIERLVYVAAFLPKNGDTPLGLMQSDPAGELLPRIVFSDDQSYATITSEDVREIFLHDVLEEERIESLLPEFAVRQATEPFMTSSELTDAAFGSVPKTYVRATLDKVMSLSLQDRMLTNWEVEQVHTLESGHFPLMSMPEHVVELLKRAADASTLHA